MPRASFRELLSGSHRAHFLPPGQITTTCHLPEKLVRDSVPRVWTGWSRRHLSVCVLQVQTPGRKAGVEYEPDGFSTGGHSRQVGGGGSLLKPTFPGAAEGQPCEQPFPSKAVRPAVPTPVCTLSYTRVLFLKGIIFFLLQKWCLCLVRKIHTIQTTKGRNLKINFDITIQI